MSDAILVSESSLTDRYQTTVPAAVRKALQLNKREKIRYTVLADGQVLLSRADANEGDPVLDQFLSFLARDLSQNPEQITAINNDLVDRIRGLVTKVEVDLGAPLSDEDG
jgi:antitoxin PrlF